MTAVEMTWPLPAPGVPWRHIYDDARARLLEFAHENSYALAGPVALGVRDGRLVATAAARRYLRTPYYVAPTTPAKPVAACQGHPDPDLWWSVNALDIAQAQQICVERCPIREQCLNAAIARREVAGVHGGQQFPLDPAPRRHLTAVSA